jgi:hypothetical protein
MKKLTAGTVICLLCACLAVIYMAGCELDESVSDADSYLTDLAQRAGVDPSLATLTMDPPSALATREGQQVVFSVTDGEGGFTWSVSDYSVGSIRVTEADDRTAVYTVDKVAANEVIAFDSRGQAALAEITTRETDLTVIPTSRTFSNAAAGATAGFLAKGGAPPYSWDVTLPALGTIQPATGTNVTYVVATNATGENIVVLTDSVGDFVTATVEHQ